MSVAQVVAESFKACQLPPKDDILAVVDTGVQQFLPKQSKLKGRSRGGACFFFHPFLPLAEHKLTQKSFLYLFRKEQVCLVLSVEGSRRNLLIDFAADVSEVILYLAVKLGLKNYSTLQLHTHGSTEVLRADRSLEAQGVTPFNRLFCLTTANNEQPFYPQDAVEAVMAKMPSSSVLKQEVKEALYFLRIFSHLFVQVSVTQVPEEMLTRAQKRGILSVRTAGGKVDNKLFVLQDCDLYCYAEAKVVFVSYLFVMRRSVLYYLLLLMLTYHSFIVFVLCLFVLSLNLNLSISKSHSLNLSCFRPRLQSLFFIIPARRKRRKKAETNIIIITISSKANLTKPSSSPYHLLLLLSRPLSLSRLPLCSLSLPPLLPNALWLSLPNLPKTGFLGSLPLTLQTAMTPPSPQACKKEGLFLETL